MRSLDVQILRHIMGVAAACVRIPMKPATDSYQYPTTSGDRFWKPYRRPGLADLLIGSGGSCHHSARLHYRGRILRGPDTAMVDRQ